STVLMFGQCTEEAFKFRVTIRTSTTILVQLRSLQVYLTLERLSSSPHRCQPCLHQFRQEHRQLDLHRRSCMEQIQFRESLGATMFHQLRELEGIPELFRMDSLVLITCTSTPKWQ